MRSPVFTEASAWQDVHAWARMVSSTYTHLTTEVRHPEGFAARLSKTTFGPCILTWVESRPARYRRSGEDIERAPSDTLLLSIKQQGSSITEQQGRRARAGMGDLVLYDLALPYHLDFPEPYRELVLQIPRPALATRVGTPGHFTAVSIPGGSPLGRLAGSQLTELARSRHELSESTQARLSSILLDIVGIALTEVAEPGATDPAASMLVRAKTLMRAHLHDSGITTTQIAARLNISVRTLNRLFAQEGETAMRWLLDERLAACHRALSDQDVHTVSEAAMAHGFVDLSHFSRTFRVRFGVRPSEVLRSGHPANGS